MSNKDELEKIRSQIDTIDESILELVNQRSLLAKETANLKKSTDIYKPEREAKIIRNLISLNEGPLLKEQVISIFNEIISSCRSLEKELKVSYLGPEGTFSEEAVKEVFGSSVTKSSAITIEEAISAVSEGNSNYAIVPIENSTEGPVNITLDCLYASDLKICGEIEMSIQHNLLAKDLALPKTDLEIHAHEQTLSQCKNWLDDYCPNIKRVAVSSNAQAAKNAKENSGILAIAGSLASEKYGLEIYGSGKLEKEFIRDCLPVNSVGLSSDEFCSYIDFIADRRLNGIGLDVLNPGLENPFPWLAETMDVKKEQNFFEGRVTEYQKSSALSEVSDDEL